jgi:hypothetical protein
VTAGALAGMALDPPERLLRRFVCRRCGFVQQVGEWPAACPGCRVEVGEAA